MAHAFEVLGLGGAGSGGPKGLSAIREGKACAPEVLPSLRRLIAETTGAVVEEAADLGMRSRHELT